MDTAIFEKAQALAEALRDSETYQQIKNLEAILTRDDEAMALMQQIAALEEEIRSMMENPDMDQQVMSEKIKAYQQVRKEAGKNLRIGQYEQAQQTFQQTMSQVNQVISTVLTGRTPGEGGCASGSCSGSCASCGSCCGDC